MRMQSFFENVCCLEIEYCHKTNSYRAMYVVSLR